MSLFLNCIDNPGRLLFFNLSKNICTDQVLRKLNRESCEIQERAHRCNRRRTLLNATVFLNGKARLLE